MLLEVKKIVVYYNKALILRAVSLAVNNREIVALIGSNGAGKTTTLKSITGLVKIKSGSIIFENKEISSLLPYEIARIGITHVPDDRGLFPEMTVYENLEISAYLREDSEIGKDLEFVYQLFPRLKERSNQLAGTLSGGEQQMLAISKGIMSKPKILILDEPSVGLAPNIVDSIFQAIKQINRERRISILIAEQNAYMALSIADRAYVMENGIITLRGAGHDILANKYIKEAYLGI